ncbi:MAG: hypothetical protein HY713_06370 [candidate division NC10 bacterium]|nr:hypothetical protein [candidate division NC10 bacterium]
MSFRFLTLVLFVVTLQACGAMAGSRSGGGQPSVYPPDVYAHRVASSHVVLYWNCARPEPNLLRFEGVAQNPWSPQEVRFLELELVGVDGRDRVVAEARGAVQDILIHTNQTSPFRMDLRTAGSEARFDLYYQYRFSDVEMEAGLAGPSGRAPRLFAQLQRHLARDVCAETKHRSR